MLRGFLPFLMIIICLTTSFSQDRQVSGNVTDAEEGIPLAGVNVLILGLTEGVITDLDGNYKVAVPEGSVLGFSYIGFFSQEIEVGSRSVIDVPMVRDVKELQEVVVTAFGITKEKKALVSSVTEIEGDVFTEAREINIANSLTGLVAGVNVNSMATGPAGASRVVIRGAKSLARENQPLYVVDGIPMDNTSSSENFFFGQAGRWGGSDWGDGISSLSPDDVESISVLKGANASALYGSRAARGVILITTKKGLKRKGIGVEFNSNFVLEQVIDYTDYQGLYGHGDYGEKPANMQEAFALGNRSWGGELDGSRVLQFDGVERPYSYTGDNIEKFYETGKIFTNTLALTGGSEIQTYRISASHLNSNGIVPNSGFDRTNLGLSLNGSYGKRKQFKVDGKILYSHEVAKNRPRISDTPGNANTSAGELPPSIDIRDLKGDPNKPGATYDGQNNPTEEINDYPLGSELMWSSNIYLQNPYWAAYQFENNSTRDRVIPSISLRYDFTEWLYGQVRAGMDWYASQGHNLTPYGTAYNRGGMLVEVRDNVRETNFDWMFGVDKKFGESGLNCFVGGNIMRKSYESLSIDARQFNIPFFHALSNGYDNVPFQLIYNYGVNSLFGSIELNYRNYLFVTATARNDWFSTLDPERNSILYPSVGVSWVFSDTFVFPSWWNIAKVRASWAQVGGATDPYNLDLTYQLEPVRHGAAVLGKIAQNDIPNRYLVPLTSTEMEVGLDLQFLDARLALDVAIYRQETTDDILSATISKASGYSGTLVNIGRMRNQGVELLLTGTPLKGKFNWDLGFNLAFNENEVLELAEGIENLVAGQSRVSARIIHQVGEPYGAIFGITHDYDTVAQDYVYFLENHIEDGDTLVSGYPVSSGEFSLIGYGVPPITGGFTNSFTWKGWNLSFLIDYKFGGDIHSGTNVRLTRAGLHKQTLQGRESDLMVTGADGNGGNVSGAISKKYLSQYWSSHSSIHEYYVYDASFVKLRQLTVGYTFAGTLLAKTPFTFLDLSFVGRNLLLLYGNMENIDPESNYQNTNTQGLEHWGVPQTRTYGFNLRIGF